MSNPVDEYIECIICHDSEDEDNLLDNFFCDCKFKFHHKCYRDWLIKSETRKCLVCENDLNKDAINDFVGIIPDARDTSSSEDSVGDSTNLYIGNDNSYSIMDFEVNRRPDQCQLNQCCLLATMLIFFAFILLIIFSGGRILN